MAAGRLDRVLVPQLPGVSRAKLQAFIRAGKVRVNGRIVHKPGFPVGPTDRIQFEPLPPPTALLSAQPIPLDILYENEAILVINKSAGMVVHPGAGHSQATLVHAALAHAPELRSVGDAGRPGIVHRLDKDTSGVMVVAKTNEALKSLQEQFRRREVEKVYLALVDGAPPSATGQVEAPLARSPRHRKRIEVIQAPKSRLAVTRFRIKEQFPSHSLLELKPLTGRTHQIRVHLQFLGCPVVGDRIYGRRRPTLAVTRQQLHSWRLRLVVPGEQQPRSFEAAIPADFREAIELARRH
ncbi:MAG: RluA family pseudouridine synthase [Anaerolineales bacterium]